jgi:GntR family transcriptional regulator, transcriptional repressor for pyruvate dehydrogenase complex
MSIDWSQLSVSPTSVSDELAERLERMIRDGELPPGAQLPPERDLQRLLGVSRVSVREALHDLELKGLIDRKPGRGTIVIDPQAGRTGTLLARLSNDERSIREIMDFRAAIEPPIAARAAGRAVARDVRALRERVAQADYASGAAQTTVLDEAFHAAIARATHNALFVKLLDIAADWLRTTRQATLQTRRRREESMAAHRRILDAIAARDVTGAAEAMADHIERVNRLLAERELSNEAGRSGRGGALPQPPA